MSSNWVEIALCPSVWLTAFFFKWQGFIKATAPSCTALSGMSVNLWCYSGV